MYSLHLHCAPEDVDLLSAELFELGTAGIRELEYGAETVLIAGFEREFDDAPLRDDLVQRFAGYSPEWELEEAVDWVQSTHEAWPPRNVGKRLFLAPPWSTEETPEGRIRILQNPGMACGTGEHPCTQLALIALEEAVKPQSIVVDIGTGSGILAIAAKLLGARLAIGIDADSAALHSARENFELNGLKPEVAAGSADCIASGRADVTVANISGTVLVSIFEELIRVSRLGGTLILTGFTESESLFFKRMLPDAQISALNEWRCVTAKLS